MVTECAFYAGSAAFFGDGWGFGEKTADLCGDGGLVRERACARYVCGLVGLCDGVAILIIDFALSLR